VLKGLKERPFYCPMDHIRNFSIIAHIDHGKSTLADRIIHRCGGLSDREMEAQVLDSMDIERERGITIKAQTAALSYVARDGKTYNLNLIDTPGHVDFSYEVSRSLSACEGALLVVDASQGVEAQTVANCYTAIELDVDVVPVLNKIDLPAADPDNARQEIEDVIGIDATDAILCLGQDRPRRGRCAGSRHRPHSAAQGRSGGAAEGADHRLLVRQLRRRRHAGARGRWHAAPKDKILLFMAEGSQHLCEQVGVFTPKSVPPRTLRAGEVGFVISGIKELMPPRLAIPSPSPIARPPRRLPGFKEIKPQVFAGLYPVESNQYDSACANRWKSSNSTMPRCNTSPKYRRRWASASVAASWACCTWKSSRNDWSANSIRI
jgi:GTP-binding protein LepA